MTISYNWLSEYLPVAIDPERLSRILTSIGLEVEKMENFEEVKGGLQGLVIGEVLATEQHPNADKLKLTTVNTGGSEPLQIVCGAPNVAAGQKVVVATVGTTIYPISGDPLTMKTAKIRGIESQGMICAEDEIGLGTSHAGIMVLPASATVGESAADYFKPFHDIVYEIGLTPNRMDAMSHWGVARDVCAYLSYHDKKEIKPVIPATNFKATATTLPIEVKVDNERGCRRYSGVCISGVTVGASPKWLQEKLKAIGLRPINNIVDITNFVQHETGQPLHAFDYDKIHGHTVIVKNLPEGSGFVTLDEKERKLHPEDLMICDDEKPMCIAGVFGGAHSGVTESTQNIFLESAYFDPVSIRRTSFRHGLRTDAASRFEKGIDISKTVKVLQRAAALIVEEAQGAIASGLIDIYPRPEAKKEIALRYHYLKKLSGKSYHADAIKTILTSLGFGIERDSIDALTVTVPYHKPDISIPADLVEEILRIDGLDNIDIPTTISISPSVEENYKQEKLREKIAGSLMGMGFSEIITNSITNAAYYTEKELSTTVKLLNNLSNELNIMRPRLLETALEVVAFNLNRKNTNLKFFEFGKSYQVFSDKKMAEEKQTSSSENPLNPGNPDPRYLETNYLGLYFTGLKNVGGWQEKSSPVDSYYVKGAVKAVLYHLGIGKLSEADLESTVLDQGVQYRAGNKILVEAGRVKSETATRFGIRQPVYYAEFNWDRILVVAGKKVQYQEVPKFPSVERDLAMVVAKTLQYKDIESQIHKLKLPKLKEVRLFDIFESEKLGADKKSMAINLIFLDEEKTLTDKEIDSWMTKIISQLQKELNADIRK